MTPILSTTIILSYLIIFFVFFSMNENESKPTKKLSYKEEQKQKEMDSATKKTLNLLQQKIELQNQLEEKKNSLQNSEKIIEDLVEQKKSTDIDLEKEKKKFFILNLIKEFYQLNDQLQLAFTKRDYDNIYTLLKEIEKRSPIIKQEKTFSLIKEESKQKIQLLFKDIILFKDMSITFSQPLKFIVFNKILAFLDSKETYQNYFFDSLINISLTNLNKKNCTVNESSIGTNPSINFIIKDEPHTPATSLQESCKLLILIQKHIKDSNFSLSDENLKKYANKSFELCMIHTGGRTRETEQAAKQLCELTKTEKVDLSQYAAKSKVPLTLDACRTIFKEGNLFGEAVKKMNEIYQGAPAEGILTKITILALVEWKNDPDKLKSAFSVFIAIGTKEALQCMMMFQNRIKEIESQH